MLALANISCCFFPKTAMTSGISFLWLHFYAYSVRISLKTVAFSKAGPVIIKSVDVSLDFSYNGCNNMSKEEAIKVEGVINKALPNAMFLITLDNGHEVLGHISGKMRKHYIRINPGDRVNVELSPYDLTRGRITYRAR